MVNALLPVVLRGAVVRKRGQRLVGPIDLTLDGQGITIILGPNGAGKTTLLRAMHGLERVASGRLEWAIPDAQAHQAFVFQTPIMMRRSVLDNLSYPLRLAGRAQSDVVTAAQDAARAIGLQDKLNLPAPRLSGGEKQKLALARALICAPQVLFLDEPCASLDGPATREIEAVLQHAKADGTRIIMSTHDIGQARRLADEIVFMVSGRVVQTGPAQAFFEAPETTQAAAFLNGDIVE
jgi:tungstate transport system ATP-binding protein